MFEAEWTCEELICRSSVHGVLNLCPALLKCCQSGWRRAGFSSCVLPNSVSRRQKNNIVLGSQSEKNKLALYYSLKSNKCMKKKRLMGSMWPCGTCGGCAFVGCKRISLYHCCCCMAACRARTISPQINRLQLFVALPRVNKFFGELLRAAVCLQNENTPLRYPTLYQSHDQAVFLANIYSTQKMGVRAVEVPIS